MSIEVELAAPTFLVAVPQLGDPNFYRSVVIVLEHSDEGSMGLVVNRPGNLSLGEFCSSQSLTYKGDADQPVFQGGPVQTDRAFILHSPGVSGPETEVITEAMHLSYSVETLKMLVETPPDDVRIFMGYAGWGPGQLASEITEGAWLLASPSPELLFQVPAENVWEASLRRMGIEPVQLVHSGAVH